MSCSPAPQNLLLLSLSADNRIVTHDESVTADHSRVSRQRKRMSYLKPLSLSLSSRTRHPDDDVFRSKHGYQSVLRTNALRLLSHECKPFPLFSNQRLVLELKGMYTPFAPNERELRVRRRRTSGSHAPLILLTNDSSLSRQKAVCLSPT